MNKAKSDFSTNSDNPQQLWNSFAKHVKDKNTLIHASFPGSVFDVILIFQLYTTIA